MVPPARAGLSEPDRFDRSEATGYWRAHGEAAVKIDFDRDPDGLGVACHVGEPLWLNRHYARMQRRVYSRLLRRVPSPAPSARALDVGCGAGRWCRVLQARGYQVVGVDLQQELIEVNRRRWPGIEFFAGSVLDYEAATPFDLVSTVTVLQHLAPDDHLPAVRKLRSLLRDGGHALVLENVRDQDPHVFAHSVAGWRELFGSAGFTPVRTAAYDYSPMLRLRSWAVSPVRRAAPRAEAQAIRSADTVMARAEGGRSWVRAVNDLTKFVAVAADEVLEPILEVAGLPLSTVHAGFLFRAV
ncbi:MAG: class I SAM-dependent DNA methyltransferase [Candidatus Dormibacteria bacterium]